MVHSAAPKSCAVMQAAGSCGRGLFPEGSIHGDCLSLSLTDMYMGHTILVSAPHRYCIGKGLNTKVLSFLEVNTVYMVHVCSASVAVLSILIVRLTCRNS